MTDKASKALDNVPLTTIPTKAGSEPSIDLSRAITYMIYRHEYYGKLVLNMKRHFTDKVPTAGVNITSQINLFINPKFWGSLDLEQQVFILLHECLHVVGNHMDRQSKIDANHKIFNVAADCAINQKIANLDCMLQGDFKPVTVEGLSKMFNNNTIEHDRESEYYYNLLKEEIKQAIKDGKIKSASDPNAGQDPGDGVFVIDDHDLWDEGDDDLKKMVLKQTLEKTKQQTGAGKTPSEVEEMIKKLSKSKVNWKNGLKRFFGNVVDFNKKVTRNRRNRRYGIAQPGKRKIRKSQVACIFDSSGSVPDSALAQFLTELEVIYKLGFDIKFIVADAVVHQVMDFKPGLIKEIKGRGGTLYQPAIDKAMELKVEGIIYFGDGDCADTITRPRIPFLWAMIEGCTPPVDWGNIIHIPITEE